MVPLVVIGAGDAVATGNGYSYAGLEVSGYGANDTFPTVEAEAQTNYAFPEAPNEGPSFSIDQTIMLEPNTVAGVYLDADAFAGEPLQNPVFQEPLAIGCPTYCGTASASLDPLIEIEPAFLAANPGYTLVFSPGFVPPLPATVPEPSTWAMLALGFAGLGLAGWVRWEARCAGRPGSAVRQSLIFINCRAAPAGSWLTGSVEEGGGGAGEFLPSNRLEVGPGLAGGGGRLERRPGVDAGPGERPFVIADHLWRSGHEHII